MPVLSQTIRSAAVVERRDRLRRSYEGRRLSLEASPLRRITEGGLTPVGAGGIMGVVLGLDESMRNAIALHPEAFITHRMTYRCKHCGKEWTKISAETIPLPKDYVIEEEEKTDADADTEAEEAREEEFVREER